MRYSISNTAEYGDYITGPKIVTRDTKESHEESPFRHPGRLLRKEWLLENQVGCPHFQRHEEKKPPTSSEKNRLQNSANSTAGTTPTN